MLPLQCLLSVFSSPPHVVFMLGDEIGSVLPLLIKLSAAADVKLLLIHV